MTMSNNVRNLPCVANALVLVERGLRNADQRQKMLDKLFVSFDVMVQLPYLMLDFVADKTEQESLTQECKRLETEIRALRERVRNTKFRL